MIAKCQVYFAKLFQSPQKDRNTFPGWCTSMMFSPSFPSVQGPSHRQQLQGARELRKGSHFHCAEVPRATSVEEAKGRLYQVGSVTCAEIALPRMDFGELPGKLNEHHDVCYFLALNFLGFHACLLRQKAPGNSGKPLLQPWRRIDSRCDTVLQHSVGHC